MMGGGTLVAFRKDLARLRQDPLSLLLWLVIPLMIGGLMTLLGGGDDGGPPKARVLLADEDDSLVSRLLAGALAQTPVFDVETTDRARGRERMDAGEASAMIIVPEGFGTAVLREEPTSLVLVKNPAERILPGMVEESLEILVDGVFYLHRILGDEIRAVLGQTGESGATSDTDVARISVAISHVIERIQKHVFPPSLAVEVAVDAAEGPGEKVDMGLIVLPGILLMALLFTAQGLSGDVWREIAEGTARRAATTPRGLGPLLAGKMLAHATALLFIGAVFLLIAMLWVDLPLHRLPLAVLWSTIAATVFLVWLVLLQLLATSARGGSIIASAVVFPLLMIGGSFFPLEMLPPWMAAIGRWTPNGWSIGHLKAALAGRTEPLSLLVGVLFLAAIGALGFALARLRFRRVAERS